jgi:cardiolipin synthase A/B
MRDFLILILIISLCANVGSAVIITEFCPDPYLHDDADEYIVLSGNGSLDGITLAGGKGGFRFPPGTTINGRLTVSRSGPAYLQSHGMYPDYEWLDYSPKVPGVIPGDTLRLANTKGILSMYKDGHLIQNITWPGDVHPREGQVHYRAGDCWDPRPLLLGQSRFEPAEFSGVAVTAFVTPDSSDDVYTMVVHNASHEILLNVYEFSSPAMVGPLITAHQQNVSVIVLVEGGPVGGISKEEKAALFTINQSGIPVYSMTPTKGEHAPYRYDHAKYLVIDKRAVFITSENFKYSGFPPSGRRGNRGWGVYLEDPDLASYFATVFATDLRDNSVNPYAGFPGDPEFLPASGHRMEYSPRTFEGAIVRPVLAPDTSSEITRLLNSATTTIDIEQAYITNETQTTINPYLSAAVNASRRGVHVRVLLDSYYYNTEGPRDNDEMVAIINRIALTEHLPLEARLIDLTSNELEKIHNKGVIVDHRKVLVSSINWNSNSPNFNREVGVIIDHPGVAQYFTDVFDDDWNPSVTSPQVRSDILKMVIVACVLVLLMIVYYRRHLR